MTGGCNDEPNEKFNCHKTLLGHTHTHLKSSLLRYFYNFSDFLDF